MISGASGRPGMTGTTGIPGWTETAGITGTLTPVIQLRDMNPVMIW